MHDNWRFRTCLLLLSFGAIGCEKPQATMPPDNMGNLSASEPAQAETPEPPNSPPQVNSETAAIDPKSAEAARNLIARYTDLLESANLSEARGLWTERNDASAIEAQLKQFNEFEAEVGDPGPMEGAAGSIYVEVPLQLTGSATNGQPLKLAGAATLRRVNGVPGSTEVQRRWHIYRVLLQPRP